MNKKIIISFLSLLNLLAFTFNVRAEKHSKTCSNNPLYSATIVPVANFTANRTIVCVGDTIAFTDLSANGPTAWKWTFNGGTPPTSITQNEKVVYNIAGTYTVKLVVSNIAGSDSMTKVNYIVVNPLPNVKVNPSAPFICKGDSVMLTASGAATYTWHPTTGLSCTTCPNPYSKVNANITYTVVGKNASGCIDSTSVTVTVGSIVVSISASDTNICQGNSDTLTAMGANSYLWSNGATTSQIIVSPSSSTTYTVIGTSLTCIDTATFKVNVFPAPNIVILGTDSVCIGGSTILTATGAVNYFWAPSSGLSCTSCPSPKVSPTITTTYTVIGTDNNGCSNATTVTVYVEQLPTVVAHTGLPAICSGSGMATSLSANGNPSGGTYVWQPCNKTGQAVIDTPTVTTVYTVYYTNSCGTATDTVRVNVYPQPKVVFFASSKSGCAQFCVQFTGINLTPGVKILTWTWDFGDGGTSNLQSPPYCYKTPGTYTVTLSAYTANCSTQTQIADYITVHALPKADFSYSPDPATILDPVVAFEDKTTGTAPITSWAWNFGDTNYFSNYNRYPTHTYLDTGYYCVQLAVSDKNGCVDTNKQCFDINSQYSFYVPSSFSPNGDNINDIFIPKGTYISNFEMYIYDRWGMQLYHTTDITDGWNGKVKNTGKICQEDVYVYVISVNDKKGLPHHYTGSIYLLK